MRTDTQHGPSEPDEPGPREDWIELAGFQAVQLAHAGTRVTILPELGGKISALEIKGRQWLWTSDVLPFRAPVPGESYVETADSGGYDECFPTVGPCTLPASVPTVGGAVLPDHGELWSQACAIDRSRWSATCTWRTKHVPARFERTVMLENDGAVRMHYRVTNEGGEPFPFLWSAHPLLPLTRHTKLLLPHGARMRVYATHGIDAAPGEHQWPNLAVRGDRVVDLSHPANIEGDWAVKVFLDVPIGSASVEEQGAVLSCSWDAREVPSFGLWINHHGWTPFHDREPYRNFAFEPCIGAPDTLSDALADWQGAHWLDGGATRAWTLLWR